jgi:hypothetical protein
MCSAAHGHSKSLILAGKNCSSANQDVCGVLMMKILQSQIILLTIIM